jgi:hypothetical protein
METMVTQFVFEEFRPAKLKVPPSRLESAEGFPLEFKLGRRMVQELGSSVEGFGNPTTRTRQVHQSLWRR